MRKLKLDLDQLTVESFDTNAPDGPRRGTVRAFMPPTPFITCPLTCADTCDTCDYSCGGTCDATCNCTGYTCCASCGGTCNGPSDCGTCQTNCEQESCVFHCP
jgi:hypothetical protein